MSHVVIMDQKPKLLQQLPWQNNIKLSNLVEKIRDAVSGSSPRDALSYQRGHLELNSNDEV